MNSLHTSAQQRSPIRGVALRPLSGRAGDSISAKAASPSLEALDAMKQDVSLLQRTLHTVLKATRTAARSSSVQVMAFVLVLFATANVATAQQTFFWVGGGSNDWGLSANWSLSSGTPGGAGVPGYGNAQDIAIFDAASGNPVITRGFPVGVPGVGQIQLLNGVSSGPQVTFGIMGGTTSTFRIGGVAASTNAPLFVGSLCKLFIDQDVTLRVTGVGMATAAATIFGDLSVRIGGTVINDAAQRFRIEDGGSLRMSGGTFTNNAGAGGAVLYALTGSRGSLVYDRNDNTTVTIPIENDNLEVPASGTTLLGNLVIRRPIGSVTTFADMQVWRSGGTLIVDGCPLTLPNNFSMELCASNMRNGGNIFAFSVAVNNSLIFRDISLAAAQTPLNPTVSDLAFGINASGSIVNGQFLNRLVNQISTMNLTINSDLNIVGSAASGLELGAAGNAGGQLTIPASRTVTLRSGTAHRIDALPAVSTGRVIVNGTFAIATGATLTNNNVNINSPLAGILVNPGGRVQLNGSGNIAGTANGAFYTDATSVLEYLDRDATVTAFTVPFPAVAAFTAPATRNANISELPADMRGAVTINRLQSATTMVSGITTVAMMGNTTMSGPLTLTQGGLGLSNRQLIVNGTITTAAGGFLAGNPVGTPGQSALVYNSAANGTIAVTTNTAVYGNSFNYLEIRNTGNLSFASGQQIVIDGSAVAAGYGLVGFSNYNGQLRFISTGNLVLNSSQITFQGAGAPNTTLAGQGGNIPITSGTVGAIVGDGGSRLIFTSNQIRSFPRFATGGQQLLELRLTGDGTTPGTPVTVLRDYMVSLRTPLQTSLVTLQNNAVLQLGNAANLTVLNPPDLITAANVPNPNGNFIDASQGGTLQLRGYLTPGDVLIPVGVSFVDVNGGVLASAFRPITVSNSVAALPGENYTVSVTSAIVNAVPAIPTLANNSMRGQWTISSGTGVNGTGGKLVTGWTNNPFNPVNLFGDEPALAGQFQPTLTGAMGTSLTTIRRWTGATYVNVLPTNPVNGGVLTTPRSIQATYNGALNNTIFIVSNELFPIYWVGGSPAAGDWGVNGNWASTSGGAGGSANAPGVNDWAVFDRAQAPRITNNIPAALQQMSVIEGANVTLAPGNLPTTLNLNRDKPDNDNLLIGPNSRLSIGSGTFTMNLTLPTGAAANSPNTAVFGTLAILANGTYNHVDATSMILIANGGTLLIGTQTPTSLPAGTTTGFVRNVATTLQYGRNQNSVPPYLTGAPAEQNATLRYEDANGAFDGRNPAVGTGELITGTHPGNLIINKTAPGSVFGFLGAYTVTSSATLQAGILDLTAAFMAAGGPTLTVGTDVNPASGAPGSRTLNITGSLPNTGIRGNNTSILNLNGPGVATLQFVPGGETLNTLLMNDASNAAPNAALSGVLNTNLTITNAFTMTNARTAVGMGYGLTVNPATTLRINQGGTITGGRVLVNGTMALPTAAPTLALPATVAAGGLDIGTTGTLNIINDGLVNGTAAVNPVRYLNVASRLLYSAEVAGFTPKITTDVEFPQIFNGTLVIDKNAATTTTTNAVQINNCKVVTQGTVQLVGGDLLLNGQLFKIGSAAQTLPAVADLLNNTISTTARLLPGGGRIWGGNAASPSSFVYNSVHNANFWLGNLNGSTHEGRFLNKIEVNGPSTLTLSTGAVVNINGVGGTPVCDGTYQGTLRLDNSTGSLALNGSSLQLTGTTAPQGGIVLTTVTGGTITGDALPGTSIRVTSERLFNIKMASGAGASLRSFGLNPAGVFPAVGQAQVSLISSMTTDVLGVTRNIVSLTSGVNLRVTDVGVNSTVGNVMAGAAFGVTNNNFVDCSPGGSLTLTIPNNTTRMFPIGATNHTITNIRPAPITITNNGGASDSYTIGVVRGLTFQNPVYPDKVNLQWTIAKGSPSALNQTVQYGWHTEHEAAPGFLRQNSFPAQWNGSSYTQSSGSLSSTVGVSTPFGMEWSQTITYPNVNMSATNPFGVIAPPVAIILAADSLLPSGSGGFNPVTPNGFASPAAGNLTITSGTPFTLRIGSFSGLNLPSPVRINTNVRANLEPLPGGTAVFNTTGTGSVGTPIVLNVPNNPVCATTTNITFDWLNFGNLTSTTAILRLYDPALNLTSATITVTILAPPLRASTIAYTQVQNSSNGTFGFNGGGLGQFNITGGVGIPINFGFFSNTNFLAATTNITSVVASIAVHPANPGSIFSTTPGGLNGAINPQTVAVGATGGFIFPIFNWTNPPVNGGITKALVTLTAPGIGSTTVTVTLSTSGTAPVPTRLGYSVNSGDLLAAATGTNGFNGGIFGPGTPITSGQQVRVNFASFVEYGAVIRPTSPTQVQLSIAADPINPGEVFTMDGTTATTVSQVDGTGSLFPRIFYTANSPGQRAAIVTLSVVSGQTTLLSTTAQVWVTTTGSIATVTSFNASVGPTTGHSTPAIGGAGINGGNRNIPSGRPFNIDFGFFNAADVLATGAGNPVQLSIVSVTPATETVTIDANSSVPLIFGARQASIQNVVLNWRNPTVAGPISVVVRLTPQNLPPVYGVIASTEATITLSTGASIPVALAFSQISSTGTQGINGNNLNIANNIPFSIDLGLFDAFGVLANSLSNSSVVLTAQAVTAGNTFSVGGNSSGVFVNQAGIRLNSVTVTWTNPTAPTTQVRLVVSTTAGAGPIAFTSAIVTISASAVFPAITGFVPATGGPGTTVLISGSNFTGVNAVSFNGASATTFTVLGDNLISVVVPAGASTGPVTVSRPQGPTYPSGSGTSTVVFTVGTPPSISSFSPTSGGTGTIVTITGTNFGTLTNLFSVTLAGVTGTVQSINAAGTEMTVLISGTSLTQRIAPVIITTAGGVGTSTQLFTYNLPPVISSVTPNSAVVNGQDIPIIIRGSNFNINLNPAPNDIQSGVFFSLSNAPQAISPSSRISIQSVSATEIRATISGTFNNMVGQRFVTVLNADGQYVNIPFQLIAGGTPTLTSITPSVTSASGVAFIATINGTNFFGSAGTTVTANGRSISILSANANQLRVIIPADLNQTPQTLNIVVRNSDGQQVQGIIVISDPGRPNISSLTPPRAIVGTSATTVTIVGSGFFLNAEVTFNNIPIQVLSNPVRTTTQIVAVIPANLLTSFGTFPLRITNPGGFSGAALFNVGYPAPTITSVLTASGAMSGQNVTAASVFPFQLAITGTGFRQGLSVRFNGVSIPVISTSDTQVIVQVPAGLNNREGVFPITLANADGFEGSSTFTIGQPNRPIITLVSPSTTNATGTPFVITVNGLNFGVTPQGQPLAGFQIRYNGTVLQILGASPTQVTAFVPAGVNSQEGIAIVQIINPDTQFAQASVNVLCSACPIISSVTPTDLRPQYNFDVTFVITGSNFQQGATVTVGGVPLRIVNTGANQITAIAPAGFFLGDPTIRVVNPDGRSFTLQNAFRPSVREVMTVEVMTGSVYPNPVEEMVSFEANLPKAGQLRVRITDVLGNTVVLFTQAVGAGKFSQQLDVSALQSGVYFFEMTDGERRFTDKLIKR